MKKITLTRQQEIKRCSAHHSSPSPGWYTKKLLLIVLWSLPAMMGYAQACQCIKAQVIGSSPDAAIPHNNRVAAMNDTTISAGALLELKTILCVGKAQWFAEGIVTPLATNIVSPFLSTRYIVKSILPGCPETEDVVMVNVLSGIAGKDSESDLVLHPNPTSGRLTLATQDKPIDYLEVVNASGVLVWSVVFDDHPVTASSDVSALKPGVYFLKVYLTDHTMYSKKFIKN